VVASDIINSGESAYVMPVDDVSPERLVAIQAAVQDATRNAAANNAQTTATTSQDVVMHDVTSTAAAAANAGAPPAEALDLWTEVGNGLEKTQTGSSLSRTMFFLFQKNVHRKNLL
jgi:hypothetical protein